MILLDTNVISALMQREIDADIVSWLDSQPAESIWTTSITVFEVRFGIELLAPGRRRRSLEEAFQTMLEEDFEGRIVPFDEIAAQEAGRIAAERRQSGRSIEIRDVQIAGIAVARKAAIATRNVRHFQGLGPRVIDPWGDE
ncbi:MAG TPA: type II toxin-antitoxin system VapC family toxin [Thermoanaerobaculia bacterium]|nr:type II toxin-antitoxin system VapC family toxin [Thermoanaerobaculia bacterium]